MKIIKTNLSIVNDKIMDHQSYVEEEESWESFIEKVKSGFLFSKNRSVTVENIKYDEFHLSCDVNKTSGIHTKHFAYIEGRVITK
jgi:hypothetical protein